MNPRVVAIVACMTGSLSCTALGQLGAIVQPPRFSEARDQPAEFRLAPPSPGNTLGGATVRLWSRVSNPNPFGLTLNTVRGTLFLEDTRAATSEFPLGLPLAAGADSVIPIDFAISFGDLPALGAIIQRALQHQPIAYRFDGTIGVDAGRLGSPVLGPMTFLRGTINRSVE
jgi:hypothetical protein